MNPLLEQFLIEARDLVEQIGQKLLALEESPRNKALVGELFRLMHTLKGNSGVLEFHSLVRVTHAAEDLLDRVRDGQLEFVPELADYLLSTSDFIWQLLDEIEGQGTIPPRFEDEANQLAARLRAWLPAFEEEDAGSAKAVDQVSPPADWGWLEQLSQSQREAVSAAAAESGRLVAVRYVPEPECFFKGDDPLLTVRTTPGLAGMVLVPAEPWPAPVDLDVYRANLVFNLLSTAGRDEVVEHFRYVSDQVAFYELPPEALARLAGDPGQHSIQGLAAGVGQGDGQPPQALSRQLSEGEEELWTRILETQRRLLDLPVPPAQWAGRLASIAATLSGLYRYRGDERMLAALEEALDRARRERTFAPLSALLGGPVPSESVSQPAPSDGGPRPVTPAVAAPAPVAPYPRPPVAASGEDVEVKYGRRADDVSPEKGIRVLKVSQEKVDRLMGLIGEMVVAKNALPYLAARAESVFGSQELSREIKVQYTVINRIAQEMQDAIMQVRMLPMGAVFQRFPRLVRDVAKKLGKEVRLVVEGEETEADKNIIEALADPLIHIVRNSLDHGIESPEARQAAGKPREGHLAIRARQEGDRVLIEVTDDGNGIDPEVVKRKAFEKGLIDEARLEALSDQEAIQLVFLPGFSTAETVSDLSGRGVGMDVVGTVVDKLGGTVRLTSETGRGTRIVLDLPLSMSVSHVMMVQYAGQNFGVPMDHVVETVRMAVSDIHTINDRRVAMLRGRIVPLFGLDELLHTADAPRLNADGEHAVLVVRVGNEIAGLLVDSFSQTIDVILKPLEGPLAGLRGFAGTALLGDGSLLLMLNLKELI